MSKADLLLKGWCHVTQQYGKGMKSLSEFCVEKNGVVVLDEKRKKKMMEEAEMGARWGDEKCAGMVSSFDCSSCLLAMEFPYFISAI